jgi:hypothetical protein
MHSINSDTLKFKRLVCFGLAAIAAASCSSAPSGPVADKPRPHLFLIVKENYGNIAAVPGGGVVAYWTDMRNTVIFGRTGFGQDAYFAATT